MAIAMCQQTRTCPTPFERAPYFPALVASSCSAMPAVGPKDPDQGRRRCGRSPAGTFRRPRSARQPVGNGHHRAWLRRRPTIEIDPEWLSDSLDVVARVEAVLRHHSAVCASPCGDHHHHASRTRKAQKALHARFVKSLHRAAIKARGT